MGQEDLATKIACGMLPDMPAQAPAELLWSLDATSKNDGSFCQV